VSKASSHPLLVLSAHFDDAVFSCGATIHRHTRQGGRAVIATVFGGPPATPQDAGSPLARRLHARWFPNLVGRELDLARTGVALRRAEDAEAARVLGATATVLPFADCIYRRLPDGRWRCEEDDDLFAGEGSAEPAVVLAVAAALGTVATDVALDGREATKVLAPLGVGNHVDHRLVRAAAERAFEDLHYYEDVPYALRAHEWRPADVRGLRRSCQSVTAADLRVKIEAAACYGSQITTFWGDTAAMADDLSAYAAKCREGIGIGEAIWHRKVAGAPDGVPGGVT
jgi:LmbE family N-acetylglucosaminyl deacetylase